MNIEEVARQERLEYMRHWRAEHKDSVKKSNAAYWQRRAEKRLASAEKSLVVAEEARGIGQG